MSRNEFDLILIGGAFSGASLALLVKRARPELRVLIVERSVAFDRKVGESTSEVGASFLTRILRVGSYLNREHLVKQGLRMWFTNSAETAPDECTEIGGFYQSRLPAFQLDRSKLDEHLLELAEQAGCEVLRPAKVREIQVEEGGLQRVRVEADGEVHELSTRWLADASGKAAVLSRKFGHWLRQEDHETDSIWGRFRGVRDLDGPEVAAAFPQMAQAVRTSRSTATNHLMGRGWWCWIIPLQNGDYSLGLTYDRRLFRPPEGGNIAERLLAHARQQPMGRLLFDQAEVVATDMKAYAHLPYRTEKMCGDGWVCVGDAAGFMDPLYSQGLDYCAHTVYAAHRLILDSLDGKPMAEAVMALNTLFVQSYDRWYRALYRGKYHYLGDAQLMHAAFLMDLASYFIGPVRLVIEDPEREFASLPYAGRAGAIFAGFMSFYNRRLAILADRRWAAGVYGRQNTGHRFLIKSGFVPNLWAMFKLLGRGIRVWLTAECQVFFLPRVIKDQEVLETEPALGTATVR